MQFLGVLAASALIPLLVGFIWYNPKVLGKAWMDSIGMTEENMKGGNMAVVFGLTYLFSFFVAFGLSSCVVHQSGVMSLMQDPNAQAQLKDPNSPTSQIVHTLRSMYASSFRTYKHGALHGAIAALAFALPFIGVNALFERRGFKYIGIHFGFWLVCLVLMGAVICHFSPDPLAMIVAH